MNVLAIISIVVLSIILLLALALLGILFYTYINPKRLVKRMREADSNPYANLTYPQDYESVKRNVIVEKDLRYPSQFNNNFYDLYYKKDVDKKLPLVIWVHGGAFIGGTRYGTENVATVLANCGFAVCSMDYDFAPEAKHPTSIKQVAELVAHLKSQENLHIDLNKITIAGDSAGAQIASQYVACMANESLAKGVGIYRDLTKETLRGCILVCGVFNIPNIRKTKKLSLRFGVNVLGRAMFGGRKWFESERCKQSVTANYVNDNFPPTYITDGNNGSFEIQGKFLASRLRANNVTVKERFFPLADGLVNHEYLFQLDENVAQVGMNDIIEFLGEINK